MLHNEANCILDTFPPHLLGCVQSCYTKLCCKTDCPPGTERSWKWMVLKVLTSISVEDTEERSSMMPFICWLSVLTLGGSTSVCSVNEWGGCSPAAGKARSDIFSYRHVYWLLSNQRKTERHKKKRKSKTKAGLTSMSSPVPPCIRVGWCSPSSPSVASGSAGFGLSPSTAGCATVGGVSTPSSSKTESGVNKSKSHEDWWHYHMKAAQSRKIKQKDFQASMNW